MPASERSFSEPLPTRLYIDTDILIAHLVQSDPNHSRCRLLLERLAAAGTVSLVLSSLSWIEFTHAITRQNFRDRLSPSVRRTLRLDRWEQPLVRAVYLQSLVGSFESLLSQFDLIEVPLTPEIRALAIHYVGQYGLRGQDAVHLASAVQEGVLDLASLDEAYRRVDGLVLWNDLMHGPR